MKIDLRKLTGSNTVSIPFSETLDLREETLYGAKPFQSPVQISGEVSNESGVLRLKGTIKVDSSSTAGARCLKPLEIPLTGRDGVLILSDDPETEEEGRSFRA